MAQRLSQPESVNVLISNANWPWPQAVAEIFQPLGINALIANSSNDIVRIIDNKKVKMHLAILDLALDELSGLQTLKIIRKHDRLLPCILLAQQIDERLLAEALKLDVFSVLVKPLDLGLLTGQLNRLFIKHYASNMFSGSVKEDLNRDEITRSDRSNSKSLFISRWVKRKKNNID